MAEPDLSTSALQVEVSSLKEQLLGLKQEYDDFVMSSSELEAELDASLAASEAARVQACDRATELESTLALAQAAQKDFSKRLAAAEETKKEAQDRAVLLEASVAAAQTRLHEEERTVRLLEDEIGDLQTQLQTSEAKHEAWDAGLTPPPQSKLQQEQETVRQEMAARAAALRHTEEVQELQAQLARAHALIDTAEADAVVSAELVSALESEVEDVGIRLTLETQLKVDFQVQAARGAKAAADLQTQLAQAQELMQKQEQKEKRERESAATPAVACVPVEHAEEVARYKAALEKAVVKLKQQKAQLDADQEKLRESSKALQQREEELRALRRAPEGEESKQQLKSATLVHHLRTASKAEQDGEVETLKRALEEAANRDTEEIDSLTAALDEANAWKQRVENKLAAEKKELETRLQNSVEESNKVLSEMAERSSVLQAQLIKITADFEVREKKAEEVAAALRSELQAATVTAGQHVHDKDRWQLQMAELQSSHEAAVTILQVDLQAAHAKRAAAEREVVAATDALVAATATAAAVTAGAGSNASSAASSAVTSAATTPQHTSLDQMSKLRDRHKQREDTLQEEIRVLQAEVQKLAVGKEQQPQWAVDANERRKRQVEQLTLALEQKAEQIQQIQVAFTSATNEVTGAQAEYLKDLEDKMHVAEKRISQYEVNEKDLHDVVQQWHLQGAAWEAEKAVLQGKVAALQEQCAVLQSEGNASALAHAASVAALTEQLGQAASGLLDAHELVESLEAQAQLSESKTEEQHEKMRSKEQQQQQHAGEVASAPAWMAEQYEQLRRRHSSLQAQLQNIRGNILVCCRARPATVTENNRAERSSVDASDGSELAFLDRKAGTWRSFRFDRVWGPQHSQSDVFSDVEPVALSVLEGFNACILAYGQTGSGKTYTMQGGNGAAFSVPTERKHSPSLNYHTHHHRHHHHHHNSAHKTTETWYRDWHGEQMAANAAEEVGRRGEEGITQRSITRLFQALASKELTVRRERFRKQARALNQARIASGASAPTSTDGTTNGQSRSPATSTDGDSDTEGETQFSYTVHLSVLEVYNECVRDLLDVSSSSSSASNNNTEASAASLDLRQAADGSVFAVGMVREPVRSAAAALAACAGAAQRRATGTTKLNEHSSRSHVITLLEVCTFEGTAASMNGADRGMPKTSGRLYLVDLAGSERVQKSGVSGTMMREAQNINKSLSALGDVMEALDKRQAHVPYRNSKLTYLLQDALGGNARTLMAVTICPTEAHEEETLFALQFSSRVRNISYNQMTVKKNLGSGIQAKNLQGALKAAQKEIRLLKQAKNETEDSLQKTQRELREASNLISAANENNTRFKDDEKKSQVLYTAALTRTAEDLRARVASEKEARVASDAQAEQLRREIKVAEKLAREFGKERDAVAMVLRAREKELNAFKAQRNSSLHVNTSKSVRSSASSSTSASISLAAVANSSANDSFSGIPSAQVRLFSSNSPNSSDSHVSWRGGPEGSVSPASGLLQSPPPPPPTEPIPTRIPYPVQPDLSHQGGSIIPRVSNTDSNASQASQNTNLNLTPDTSSSAARGARGTRAGSVRGREALARHHSRMESRRAGRAVRKLPGFD